MKMVMVKWIDSHEVQGWTPVSELSGYAPKEIRTIGFEIDRTEDGIVVAASFGTDPDQVCGTMMIPSVAITEVIGLEIESAMSVLQDIATMPHYDQDDHCRMRNMAERFISENAEVSHGDSR